MSDLLTIGMAKKPHGNRTHGMSKTPEYRAWRAMIGRCENRNRRDWHNYGGRGVRVCDRWRRSFAAFLSDMGAKPSPSHSVDRIDNDGNYEPGNCRWATKTQQARNSRQARLVTYGGETLCLAAWSERTGLHWLTILKRLQRGWTPERALTTQVGRESRYLNRPGTRLITLRGETATLTDWARRLGVTKQTLSSRIKRRGVEKALEVSNAE